MTSRMQITVDPDLARVARERARDQGISFAEYVRRLIARDLGDPGERAEVNRVFDLVRDGAPTDVARDKDRMIAEALDTTRRGP